MILELATVMALSQEPILCPYVPVVDPPHRKYTCYILRRLGYPLDRDWASPKWHDLGLPIPTEGGNAEPREVGSIVHGAGA